MCQFVFVFGEQFRKFKARKNSGGVDNAIVQ
jgi:hypothetical protein